MIDLLAQLCTWAASRLIASLDATWPVMSRSVVMACSSWPRVSGSFCATIISILCARPSTASLKPTRFSAGVRPRKASRTSARPCSTPAQGAGIDAAIAAFGDALGQALDLLLDGVDGLARHRFVERAADVAEFGAQGVDRVLDAGTAQRLDLIGDLAQMFFEAGQILARHRHQRRRRRIGQC